MLSDVFNNPDNVSLIASLAKQIIEIAEKGNDIALSVLLEATRNVAEYILFISENLQLNKDNLIISGNGSIIKNKFYRMLLNQALEFEFNQINWSFSDISPAYSAGILAGAAKNINIPIDNIGERLYTNWYSCE